MPDLTDSQERMLFAVYKLSGGRPDVPVSKETVFKEWQRLGRLSRKDFLEEKAQTVGRIMSEKQAVDSMSEQL